MDLSRFDTRQLAAEGVELPLKVQGEIIPGDDGKPVVFRIRGSDDLAVKAAVMAAQRPESVRTAEDVDASDIRIATAALIGWSDNFSLGNDDKGQPVKLAFSRETVGKILVVPALRDAVLAEVFNRDNFMKGR